MLSQKLEKLRNRKTPLEAHTDKSTWVRNLSARTLTAAEMQLLTKGLNFAFAPKMVKDERIISDVEMGIRRLPEGQKMQIRGEISRILRHAKPPASNLSKEEYRALNNLKKDDSIIIGPADKGNCVVIMNRTDYVEKVTSLLSEENTYKKLMRDPTKATERKMNQLLLKLKKDGKFDESLYFRLRSTDGSAPPFYGLVKVHKAGYPLRPIVSFIGSPTYNLSRHLTEILSPLVGKSSNSVHNSIQFCEFIRGVKIPPGHIMVSFDVVSLFTNVPKRLALEVAKMRLDMDPNLSQRTLLSAQEIVDLLSFCLDATEFVFNGQFFKQVFGCAMGSPVSALVANLVMEEVEERILTNSLFQVQQWKRYVDDTWVVLPADQVDSFLSFINSVEPSINFTMETENDAQEISFLDVLIRRKMDGSLSYGVYRKPTHTDKYLNFASHHPPSHKSAVVRSLTDRARTHFSEEDAAAEERHRVLHTLADNGFPEQFLRRHSTPTGGEAPHTSRGTVTLPYVAGVTERIGRVLRDYDLRVSFRPPTRLSTVLHPPKDRPKELDRKAVVYKVQCADCDQCYVGQTGNALSTRIKQHRAAFRLGHPEKSAIALHAYEERHQIQWDSPVVLAQESRYHNRLFLESWFIHATSNCLNRTDPMQSCYLDLMRAKRVLT